jgi:adenylate cyclase
MRRWLDILLPALVLLVAVLLRVNEGQTIDRFRNIVFDTYQRILPRAYVETPVRIVDIDEESLARLGQWPWPRTLMAQLIDRLAEVGVAAVALDILFSEPDRLSPAALVELWRDRPEAESLRRALATLPDPDAALAQSLARANAVTAFALLNQPNKSEPAAKSGFAVAGDDPLLFARRLEGAVASLPGLEAAAAGNGSVNTIPDDDGIVRRVPLLFNLNGRLVPSLAAEALRVAQGAGSYTVKASGASGEASFGGATGITHVRIGSAVVPTDPSGSLVLYDSGHAQAERFVPAWQVLEPDFDPALLSGRIVFIGTSAEGLKDVRSTPLAAVIPGVEIHAQVVEQILSGAFLLRPDWADGAELLFLIVLGLILMLALRRVGALWSAGIGVVALAGAMTGSWLAFSRAALLFDPVFPAVVVVLMYIAGTLLGYLRTEGEKRYVRAAFGRYLSPVLVEQLTESPERLVLGGELRDLTLMFCDIRDFTHISERLQPQQLTHLINGFLTPMTTIIQDNGGTIDKYIGDCIMAFWNAPLTDPHHAANAVRASLVMLAELERLNIRWAEEARMGNREPMPVAVGIGLNTGMACVGNMGSEQRFDYSVLGDTVNIASRIEGLSRIYGVPLVLGEETAAGAAAFALLEIDAVRVKGRTSPLRLFTVLGDEKLRADPGFAALAEANAAMIAAYRARDFAAARGAAARARAMAGAPGPFYELYERRIAEYISAPPPADWDGVYVAKTKAG